MPISRPLPSGVETPLPGHARIAAGLLISVALHAVFILVLRPPPHAASDAAPARVWLTLRLRPPPVPPLAASHPPVTPAASRPAQAPHAARMRPTPVLPVPGAQADQQANPPAAEPLPDPLDAAPSPPAADVMAAARRDAATFARELNKEASRDGHAFGNGRQAMLDRQFEEAYQGARRWNGALPMKEVTRASDGNTRVYVLSTLLGKVCMFTRIEEPPPGVRMSPGERTRYGPCNR